MSNHTCNDCPEWCEACSDELTCSSCYSRAYLDTKTKSCLLCSPGCFKCSSASFCQECSAGSYHQVVDGKQTGNCLLCKSPCYQCEEQPSRCLNCRVGYYLIEYGKCSKCATGCLACDNNQGCFACALKYNKITDSGTSKCLKCPDNCISCKYEPNAAEMQCTNCIPGYTKLSSGECIDCSQTSHGCKKCSVAGPCEECW